MKNYNFITVMSTGILCCGIMACGSTVNINFNTVDAAVATTDMDPKNDMATPTHDMAIPTHDMATPTQDMAIPRDMAIVPDLSHPDDAGGTIDASTVVTVAQCLKNIGWQNDYLIAADINGFMDGSGNVCLNAITSEWYEENASTTAFDQIIAWDTLGTCAARTPTPLIDGTVCGLHGTHTWETIPGIDPSVRMAMTETIATVTGDYYGAGTDTQCGPVGILAGSTVRYLVEISGACQSGTKVWQWETIVSDTEPVPPSQFATPTPGTANPAVLCNKPGTIGPSDHLPGRKICPTALIVL